MMDTASATLSLERKIVMHEAREGIIDRLARDLPTNIDLERFLNVVVSELGRMLDADRCDLLQLGNGKDLFISHEWRKDKSVPKSIGTRFPFDAETLAERIDFTKPVLNTAGIDRAFPKRKGVAGGLRPLLSSDGRLGKYIR